MRITKKSTRFAVALVALTLVSAACSSSSSDTATTDAPAAAPAVEAISYPTSLADCATATVDYTAPASTSNGMTITYDIAPAAVWEDGSPITVADFKATWDASLHTPGSLSTVGYDQITTVEAGTSDKQVVATFKSVYAPYKGLFGALIKAASVKNTADVSGDFASFVPFSARPYKMKSWSKDQVVYVPNDKYWGTDKAVTAKAVMVPKAEEETAIAALKAGEVDFIFPQFHAGLEESVVADNITKSVQFGGDYEAFYFNQQCGPFADPNFRAAFSMSIDRDALFAQIYTPFAPTGKLLQCGPIVPGPFCAGDEFAGSFDMAGAEKIMTDNGWSKNDKGFWAKDGMDAPQVRWTVNVSNSRRLSTQAYLIPLLQAAGFDVHADNADAATYFQKRLPALDYDMAMYISTAPPDPAYLTSSFVCDQIPTAANEHVGQNTLGWCNKEASDLLHAADAESDPAMRAEDIKSALKLMAADRTMLPLFQFPKVGFWRADKLGGPVDAQINNYTAFINFDQWTDLDKDGQIVIGAEQWPDCLNPITECANSSWMVWTTVFPVSPGAFATTNDGAYVVTNLLSGEPVVKVL